MEDALDKIKVRKLISRYRLDSGLDLSKMKVTRIRAMRDDALFDIFDKIYEIFEGSVVPRLKSNGISLEGAFSYVDRNRCGTSTTAPLGVIIDSINLGMSRISGFHGPHYVRFNTEFCMDVPPERNYTELDKLMDAYVSEIDSEFIASARAGPFREWTADQRRD